MHPNYRNSPVRFGAAALPHAPQGAGTILSNRSGVVACALESGRDNGGLS
jgi:hypothetical protein